MAWRAAATLDRESGSPGSIFVRRRRFSWARPPLPSISTASTRVRTPSWIRSSTSTVPVAVSRETLRTSTVASRKPSWRNCSATCCVATFQASALKTIRGSEVR